jgi:hypothetical protein
VPRLVSVVNRVTSNGENKTGRQNHKTFHALNIYVPRLASVVN